MSLAFRQFKVYLRVLLTLVIGVGVTLVMVMNRSYSVRFWFFWLRDANEPINVIWLMLCTAGGTLISWWVLSAAWTLIRDWTELKRLREEEDQTKARVAREATLDDRERRVSEAERKLGESGNDHSGAGSTEHDEEAREA